MSLCQQRPTHPAPPLPCPPPPTTPSPPQRLAALPSCSGDAVHVRGGPGGVRVHGGQWGRSTLDGRGLRRVPSPPTHTPAQYPPSSPPRPPLPPPPPTQLPGGATALQSQPVRGITLAACCVLRCGPCCAALGCRCRLCCRGSHWAGRWWCWGWAWWRGWERPAGHVCGNAGSTAGVVRLRAALPGSTPA